MASAPDPDTPTCSICMDVFVDPVTTVCGHTFCQRCLEVNFQYNDRACPLCKTPLNRVPEVNIVLRAIFQRQEDRKRQEDADMYKGRDGEVACDTCTDSKFKAVKSCLVCLASYCPAHLRNHSSTPRLRGHKLVAPVSDLDSRACPIHGRPLELYDRKRQRCICVRCLEEASAEEVVSNEDEWQKKKDQVDGAKRKLEAKIQWKEIQLEQLKAALKSCTDEQEKEWEDVADVFDALMVIVEEAKARALLPLTDRREVIQKEAETLRKQLEADIRRLQTTISELDQLETMDDHILFLQNFPPLPNLDDVKEVVEVDLDTSLCFGTMRKMVADMMDKVQQELDKLTLVELRRVPKFAADVKLDPGSAHRHLIISSDGKEVKDGAEDQEAMESAEDLEATESAEDLEATEPAERFDMFKSVLSLHALTAGRSYWEVEVGDKTGWDLGVARGDANRQGKLSLNPENGYWVTVHYEGDKYAALTEPPLGLSPREKPKKVGVFVDSEEGLVSFYDVTAQAHLHTFTGCVFGREVFPYFSPHAKRDDENAAPLIISAAVKPGAEPHSKGASSEEN